MIHEGILQHPYRKARTHTNDAKKRFHACGKYKTKTSIFLLDANVNLCIQVRGDFAIDVGRNVCHGSDGVETAKREIGLWFRKYLHVLFVVCVCSTRKYNESRLP
jgi:hypothetical protein